MEENLGAADVELTPEDLQAVESASSKLKFEGARYSAFHEQLVVEWMEQVSEEQYRR